MQLENLLLVNHTFILVVASSRVELRLFACSKIHSMRLSKSALFGLCKECVCKFYSSEGGSIIGSVLSSQCSVLDFHFFVWFGGSGWQGMLALDKWASWGLLQQQNHMLHSQITRNLVSLQILFCSLELF